MFHPAFMLRARRGEGKSIPSEDERMFNFDLERAFADIAAGLPKPVVHTAEMAHKDVIILRETNAETIHQLATLLAGAAKAPIVGLDYETNCLRPYAAGSKVLSAAVATHQHTFAFPFDHPQAKWSDAHRRDLDELWKRFLRLSQCTKVAHNLSFELEWTAVKFGVDLIRAGGSWADTASQAAVIDERRGKSKPGCFSLEFLVQQYFGFNLKALSNVNRAQLEREELGKVLRYNAPDAKYGLLLYEAQSEVIALQGLQVPAELSRRRVPTMVISQVLGLPVEQREVKPLLKKYETRIDGLLDKIAALPIAKQFSAMKGAKFNPRSDRDVHFMFADLLKCPECKVTDKYTKRERTSADESVLQQIDHPLAKLILQLRGATKNLSAFIEPLAPGSEVLYPDGMLHPTFNTYWAETARISAEGPNVQQFPKRDDEAKEVRRPVQAAKDCTILAFDYGQIEARVIAMFTKDKAFCKALWERYDVHMEWAKRLAQAYPKRIGGKDKLSDAKAMKDFRTDVKNQWTFPLFFGARAESASYYLDIPLNTLQPHYNAFWKQFSGVKKWQDDQMKFYRDNGYVESLLGRRRHGPLSPNQICNTPVQSTAADIVVEAMCRLSETGDPELQPELQIHDDLSFFRVPTNRTEEVAEKILDILLDVPFKFVNVPITVELASGKNWAPYDKISNPDGLQHIGDFSSDDWFT
jgi:DNA polymerase-1